MKYVLPACLLILASCATALDEEPPIVLEEPTPTWSLDMPAQPTPDTPVVTPPETPRQDPPPPVQQGCVPDPENDAFNTAIDLRARGVSTRTDITYTAQGTLCGDSDEDWFIIDVSPRWGLEIEQQEEDSIVVTPYIIGPRGVLEPISHAEGVIPMVFLGGLYPDSTSYDSATLGTQDVPASRSIYLHVAHDTPDARYNLRLRSTPELGPEACRDDVQEPNDDISRATRAPVSERARGYTEFALQGSFCDPRDRDWFAIDYQPGLDLELELLNANDGQDHYIPFEIWYQDVRGELRQTRITGIRSGRFLGNDRAYLGFKDLEFEAEPTALYIVMTASERGFRASTYDIRARTRVLDRVCLDTPAEPNNDVEEATPLPLDRQVVGHLCTPGDTDWYVVSGLEPGAQLDIELHNVAGSARAMVFYKDPEGRLVAVRDEQFQPLTLDTMGSYFDNASPELHPSLKQIFIRVTFVEDEVYYLTVRRL